MADRFQLETDIVNLHNTADDIDLLVERILEADDMDTDTISNALIGIAVMTRLRVDKAFESFKAAFKLDNYAATSAADEA
ncbi:hypothetical protein EBZ80_21445 [bacterium]|nr:hypothetical protein [Betaproteobacteria bacterium]NDE17489.1 hypothetical protein [bacterium]